MPAYFVAEVDVTSPAGYEPYRAAVPATIAQYGGRYLTPGGAAELIEGGPEPKRVVILEFADVAAVKRWYDSPEYQKILTLRLANSTGRAFIVEGGGWPHFCQKSPLISAKRRRLMGSDRDIDRACRIRASCGPPMQVDPPARLLTLSTDPLTLATDRQQLAFVCTGSG